MSCSGQGVIGAGREVEGEPALALLAFSLPGAELTAVHLTQEDLESGRTPQDWHRLTGVAPEGISAWLLFADPFTMDAEALVRGLSEGYPGTPLVCGLASGDPRLPDPRFPPKIPEAPLKSVSGALSINVFRRGVVFHPVLTPLASRIAHLIA